MSSLLAVKDFDRFQHYKDRRPAWIKLYNDLLDDYAFTCLPDASKWLAVGLWLLASRHENRIPNDPKWIARMVHASEPVDLKPLINAGFIAVLDDASNPLAHCKQDAMPEKETEKETDMLAAGTGTHETDQDPIERPAEVPSSEPALQVIITANRAMAGNDLIDQQRFRPIDPGHGRSVQQVADWLQAGIPIATILEVVQERCSVYEPNDRSRQINSLAYLDGAVREEHAKRTTVPVSGRFRSRASPGFRVAPDDQEYEPTPYTGLRH